MKKMNRDYNCPEIRILVYSLFMCPLFCFIMCDREHYTRLHVPCVLGYCSSRGDFIFRNSKSMFLFPVFIERCERWIHPHLFGKIALYKSLFVYSSFYMKESTL